MSDSAIFLVALMMVVGFWVSVAFERGPDYAAYPRTGEHEMLPKYEVEGEGYVPPFSDRLGTKIHWTECQDSPMETRGECIRRTGCITDSDCLEWEDWLARHDQ